MAGNKFWTQSETQPKRNYRWLLTFGAGDNKQIVWWAKTVTVPSYEVSEQEHDFLDNKYYYPGRVTWTEITMTLVDPVSPDATADTLKKITAAGYKVKSLPDLNAASTRKTISKEKATGALGVIKMELLNAEGEVLEEWSVHNSFIKSAKYGDLDYSNDELRTIEMTVRYDWASCIFKNDQDFDPKPSTGAGTGAGQIGLN